MNEEKYDNSETFKISGDWANQSKTLKSKFILLTDADLRLEPGRDHEMLSRVQQRLSKSRQETIRIIRNAEENKPASPGQSRL